VIGTYQRTAAENGDIGTILVPFGPCDAIYALRPDCFGRRFNIDHILREYHRGCGACSVGQVKRGSGVRAIGSGSGISRVCDYGPTFKTEKKTRLNRNVENFI
jgi:hypothetical protein